MPRIIQVCPYDPRWPYLYRQEARKIVAALSGQIILIHHIGSTAIPGIKSKPILDCLIEVHQIEAVDKYNGAMAALEYWSRGENGIAGRRYFVKGTAGVHFCHVHIFQHGHSDIARHLNFRDYLHAHPDEARSYSELKETLAQNFQQDPVAYTNGKSDFIRKIDRAATIWCAG